MNKETVIIGIGNLILKDEGVGVHAVRELEKMEIPPGVEVIDGGVATMDLLSVIHEAEKIIVIDAIKAGGEPGAVYRVTPEDLINETERSFSLHQVDFLDVLGMARQLGGQGEVVIIGVEPKEISWGMELTPEVQAKLPKIIATVFEELGGLEKNRT